ncbi:MAG: histidine--tRNA ligase [Thermaerobacter sp.]|nr:histidine--tRNA ligase [Thermaerobacter sp.]
MELQRPRGTQDILPGDSPKWQRVEAVAHRVAQSFGYAEIRTPTFEHVDVFRRGVGDGTDIVEKEMYEFQDHGGRALVLRPESTAAVARALLQASAFSELPLRLYYLQRHFRYERPQSGRLREHTQFGVEAYGAAGPLADAEVIALAQSFLGALGLTNLSVRLNSIGDGQCRPAYRAALLAHLEGHRQDLCADCQRRMERNPLRVLDCKNEGCRRVIAQAPQTLDHLCADCRAHLEGVEAALSALGISFSRDASIVRGLDYYTRTVFEVQYENLGAQSTVCGGGRYDGLVDALGGAPQPGVGFGLGVERLLLTLEEEGLLEDRPAGTDVFVAWLGGELGPEAMRIAQALRASGLRVEEEILGRSLKAQLRRAQKLRAAKVVILGPQEFLRGVAILRDMTSSQQEEVPIEDLPARVGSAAPRD